MGDATSYFPACDSPLGIAGDPDDPPPLQTLVVALEAEFLQLDTLRR